MGPGRARHPGDPRPLAAGQGAGGAVAPDAPGPTGQGVAAGGDRDARGGPPLPRGLFFVIKGKWTE